MVSTSRTDTTGPEKSFTVAVMGISTKAPKASETIPNAFT